MKKKGLTFLATGLASVCALSVGVGIATSASSAEGWSKADAYSDKYAYGTTLSVENQSYTKDGEAYEADAIVCFPDGSVSKSDKVELSQAGTYTVKYTAKAGDKTYAHSESFRVDYPMYSVGKADKSGVSYGTPDRATSAGVMASVAQNDSLTFTQYIDFTKITADDVLVEGYVTPSVAGASEFGELILTFTDSVDPSIYFQVHYYAYQWATHYSYVAANGNNQVPVGIHQTQGQHTNNGYGMWSYVSFASQYLEGDAGSNPINMAPDYSKFFISMDYAGKKLYSLGFPKTTTMITDLDDESLVDEIWTGFPSGKAQLSVSAYGYYGATANFCITKVCGIDDLENNVYIDNNAPVISVDDEYAEAMPEGRVGYGYTIPEATAWDDHAMACDVQVAVKYNYGKDNATDVQVTDGKFTTDRVGTYAIVYTATDAMGNSSEAVRWVTVSANASDADFALPQDKTTEAKIGSLVPVPEVSPEDVTGGSGKKTVQTYVEKNGAREEINGSFRALELGTYKVVYVATDYVGKTAEKSYDVTVTDGDKPILENDYDLYPVYISENSYTLPAYTAYDYVNGALEKNLCDVIVNGTAYKAGETFSVEAAENGEKILFEIKSKDVTLATHEAVCIKAWDKDEDESTRLFTENYFVGEGFTKERTGGGMKITAESAESFGFTFGNALSNKHLTLSIGSVLGATAGTRFTFTAVDAINNDKTVSMTLGYDGANVYLEVNGVRETLAGKQFVAGEDFTVTYTASKVTAGSVSFDVSKLENFESDKIFLYVSVEGLNERGSFLFKSLGNMPLGISKTDRIEPVLLSTVEMGGSWHPGSQCVLYAPIAYDVLSPNMVYTLTVVDANKQPVTDVNGVLLKDADPTKDYTIILDQVGYYRVTYTAYESEEFIKKGNKESLGYTINVVDEVAPEIVWDGEIVTEAKVGDTIVVPNYTVSDNFTASEDLVVSVFVENPYGNLILLPGNAIKVSYEGVYEIRVMVTDASGNLLHQTFKVNVTKGV